MELSDRRNWQVSALVGVLLALNAVLWTPRAEGFWDWASVIALTVGGLLAMANGVRALRDPGRGESMEWTPRKSAINLVASVVLTLTAVGQATVYLG